MKIFYTDRAKDDLESSFNWYQNQRKGLGFEFLDCVEAAVINILNSPLLYPKKYLTFRICLVRRFPFKIFYTIENNMIVIHSIFDDRQNPDK
jgi:plasmid stabilization system protein ParE